jgi:hypothetical protein
MDWVVKDLMVRLIQESMMDIFSRLWENGNLKNRSLAQLDPKMLKDDMAIDIM